jgi:putative salt-induced outer membrane protein YdiY
MRIFDSIKKHCLSVTLATAGLSVCSAAEQPADLQTNAPKWVSSAALGVTLTRGNSDTTTISVGGTTERKWGPNDLSLGADGLYGNQKVLGSGKSQETADLLHGFVQYNRSFTEKFYAYFRADGLHDGIADIQYRATWSPGAGYYFIKDTNTDISIEVGPSWIDEKLGHSYLNYAALRVAQRLHQRLSDRARIWETLEWLPQVDHLDNYIANAEFGVEADLTKKKNLSLRWVLDDTYNNVPAAGRLKNDLKMITAIAYKF